MTRSHQISSPNVEETTSVGRANACNLCHLDRTLAWSDKHLAEWYGHRRQIDKADEVAVGISMALTGDPGIRAMAAWHMGWEPARQVSGDAWLPPYLAILMKDKYDAVRFIADRSLRRIEGYENIEFDFVAKPSENILRQVMDVWNKSEKEPSSFVNSLLITKDGKLDHERIQDQLEHRNTADLSLEE